MRILLTIAIMISSFEPGLAQVNSGSFNLLLKTLLSNKTPKITIPQAAKNFNDYLFLDAREREEFEVSRILNAQFIGYKNFKVSTFQLNDKKKPIVVYCSIGKRSEEITKQLKDAGFTNVNNLYGGLFEWVNQGHPVYDNQNKLTEKVHAYSKLWGHWLDRGIKVYK